MSHDTPAREKLRLAHCIEALYVPLLNGAGAVTELLVNARQVPGPPGLFV